MQDHSEDLASLDRASPLMHQLIELLDPETSRQNRVSLQRMLVHVGNIRKHADLPGADRKNIIKRLRDFANALDRIDFRDAQMARIRDVRGEISDSLRHAADELQLHTPAQ